MFPFQKPNGQLKNHPNKPPITPNKAPNIAATTPITAPHAPIKIPKIPPAKPIQIGNVRTSTMTKRILELEEDVVVRIALKLF